MDTITQDKSDIESYLVLTFSKIVDEYGQQLDITLALPTLVELIEKGGHDDSDKKYTFVGEAACQFAVRCILAKQYSKYDDRILDALAKKFRAFQQVNKIIWKDIDLKKQIQQILPQDIIQTMAGVLYNFSGLPAVEKFIENAVFQIAAVELGEATTISIKANQQAGPIQKFHELVYKNGGTLEANASETYSNHWQIQIVAKIKQTSITFSHSRIAQSKQKARSAACQDILNYFENHPDSFQQLQQPDVESTDIHLLPISVQDYSVSTEANTVYPSTCNNNASNDPNNVHISIAHDEDTVRQLSRLLLGCNSDDDGEDMAESPTKKRLRGVESMFSPTTETMQTSIKSEHNSIGQDLIGHDPIEQDCIKQDPVKPEDVAVKIECDPAENELLLAASQDAAQPTTAPEEALIDCYNPFAGVAPTVDNNPKVIAHFKEIFKSNRNALTVALGMPGQSKSIFLSLVLQNSDKVQCESEIYQVGPPHGPVFSAKVVLKSKRYGNVFIITEGVSRKKKDAECHAFHKLVNILK